MYEKVKEEFLSDNHLEEGIQVKVEKGNFTLDDIDSDNEEVWMLQCPRGTNISTLKGNKLKFPGRTNLHEFEVVTSQWPEEKKEAFGYDKYQGGYGVRLLPLKGNIVVRKSLKSNDDITPEQIEASCQHAPRPDMPSLVKVRHPLFGQSFRMKLELNHDIEERLQESDKSSLRITRQARKQQQLVKKSKNSVKQAKRKCEPQESNNVEIKSPKTKRIKQEVSDDLQWLKNV